MVKSLPCPRPSARFVLPRKAGPRARSPPGEPVSPAPKAERAGRDAPVERPSGVLVRRRGRSGPGGRSAIGCARCDPRPRTGSSRDSTALDTRRGGERCSASRCGARGARTDRQGGRARSRPPSRPGRRGRRSVRPRLVPSDRYGDLAGPFALRLGSLTYRTVHRRLGDDRTAVDAVLSCRRRRHGADRPGGKGRHVGQRAPGGRVGVPRGRLGRTQQRSAGRQGRRGGRRRGGRCRGRSTLGGRALDLGQRETALRAEQRAVGIQLTTVKTDRHAWGKVNAVYHRPYRGETPVGRTRHTRPRALSRARWFPARATMAGREPPSRRSDPRPGRGRADLRH